MHHVWLLEMPPTAMGLASGLVGLMGPLSLGQASGLFVHAGLAAAGVAAVAIPIVIHLLSRLKRKPQLWGAMRFLLAAYRKHKRRLQLEQWLLLALRCLVVLLLGLALAQPLLGGLAQRVGFEDRGRLVYLVIDDSLSSQSEAVPGQPRFDGLKQQALAVLDGLGPSDRAAVWRASRPAEGVFHPASVDVAAARQAVEDLQPRHSRSDLSGALADVSETLRGDAAADRVFVVVLSDWARHVLHTAEGTVAASGNAADRTPGSDAQAVGAAWRDLGERATLRVSRPLRGQPNVQATALTPRRGMLLVGGGGSVTIPLDIELHRYGAEQEKRLTGVEVAAYAGASNQPLGRARVQHRWRVGQTEAKLHSGLTLEADAIDWQGEDGDGDGGGLGFGGGERAELVLRARLENPDQLTPDDARWATVELRRRLRVAVITGEVVAGTESPTLPPRRWVHLALDPQAEGDAADARRSRIAVQEIPAQRFQDAANVGLDAAIVLHPQRLRPAGWQALQRLAARGGLVWLCMPNRDQPMLWGQALDQHFDLPWQIGLEPRTAGPAVNDPSADSDEGDNSDLNEEPAWSLDAQSPVPEPLSLLASDWERLLRPVRVERYVPLQNTDAGDVWLWLEPLASRSAGLQGNAPDANARLPLLVSHPVGDGQLLLLATALDTRWSNLPTKPLFVPLLHETLRGVLGSAERARRRNAVNSGDQPRLDPRWATARQLEGPAGTTIRLQRRLAEPNQAPQPTPTEPLDIPGIYTASPGAGLILPVNVDARGGDTRAIDEAQLKQILDAAGPWQWLDSDDPAAALRGPAQRASLGWPLLWLALGLILLETCLARWFSHADTGQRIRIWDRIVKAVRESST